MTVPLLLVGGLLGLFLTCLIYALLGFLWEMHRDRRRRD
jgi:hypothetical protein